MDFNRVGCLPKIINLSRLNDGVGIEAIPQQHNARRHDSSTTKHPKISASDEREVDLICVAAWKISFLYVKDNSPLLSYKS